MVLLHGTLDIKIEAARGVPKEALLELPDAISNSGFMKALHGIQSGIGMTKPNDPYCVIRVGATKRGHTRVIYRETDPTWDESFVMPIADDVDNIMIQLKDADSIGATPLGTVTFPVFDVITGIADDWYPVKDLDGNVLPDTSIKLSIKFTPLQPMRGLREAPGPIPDVYFPLRPGCRVKLYNDAHQEPGHEVELSDGRMYESSSLWTDMHAEIMQANRFIYVTGWSVQSDVKLVRDPSRVPDGQCLTVGELLIQKATQGVRVLVMPWDDRTGIMSTHDETTFQYFQGTPVICQKCLRDVTGADGLSMTQKFKTGVFFSHHQKAVMMDLTDPDGNTRVVAYVGGVDLTIGRFDTREHPLFSTLTTLHAGDYYQACFAGATAESGGPRQPWHDIHSRLEGPVAYDVLHNFEQRWKISPSQKDNLLALDTVGMQRPMQSSPVHPAELEPSLQVASPEDPDAWNVQVFRSIDIDSVVDYPTTNQGAVALGLATDKGKTVDMSIQKAYIHAIRRAQHFIYIENQYFLGSSHQWAQNREAGCVNLIPLEIALKIASKIAAGERFAVYVVMPLFPEGDPAAAAAKEIMRFQYNTMCMMYKIVFEALFNAGRTDEHPTDFLSFFCLGNREPQMGPSEVPPTTPPEPGSFYAKAQMNRRGMVYVHSKMMIVDDEYIIVGSANINQRSMDGSRDTELAMGAYQNGHMAGVAPEELPRGQVHGFRVSLWVEHTNQNLPGFLDPASLDCMREMRTLASANWAAFAAQEMEFMPGHLMTYPLDVNASGQVSSLESCPNIPDTEVPIVGSASGTLPDELTT